MPTKKRNLQAKLRKADDETWRLIDQEKPDYITRLPAEQVNATNSDLTRHLKHYEQENGRRAAAYAVEANAKRSSDAIINLVAFSAKYRDLIFIDEPARKIAYLIYKRDQSTLTLEAIAVKVRRARKAATKDENM